jgi:hypothetical protein
VYMCVGLSVETSAYFTHSNLDRVLNELWTGLHNYEVL